MEFPGVGNQCDSPDCNRLDFLPLKCECGLKFCAEHFTVHIDSCRSATRELEIGELTDVYECEKENCGRTGFLEFYCVRCKKNFCLEHRHTGECEIDRVKAGKEFKKDYDNIRKFEDAKAEINKEIDSKIAKAKSKGKNVAQIQLMRIKGKAIGPKSIPISDRVYFNVKHLTITQAIFVSKAWTVGRAIDAMANELMIPNKNNQSNALKLKLFKTTGDVISKSMSEKLEEMLSGNSIIDGEDLILESVPDDCFKINNL